MKSKKILFVAIGLAVIAAFFYFDLRQYLTLDAIKAQQVNLAQKFDANPVAFALSFFAIYVVMTAASFPGAALLTLLAGAIFGFCQILQ